MSAEPAVEKTVLPGTNSIDVFSIPVCMARQQLPEYNGLELLL
jgi:hypothetical protein